jgi:hypothetical protein
VQFHRIRNIVLLAILCAALTPAVASGASLRMVVQSHPDFGGKCADVPWARFVEGMRVQMWDCNSGAAQTFTYDDQSQELKAGSMCVTSWGQGHPQDPVGLSSCNAGAKQHWRVVANGNYYQFIGGLCGA